MKGNNCSRCIYTDSPCVPSDYGRDEHNNCDHFKSVFEENEELKAQIEKLKSYVNVSLPNDTCYKCGKELSLENRASVILTSNPPKYLCKECAGEKEVEKHKWNDILLGNGADYDKKIAEEYTTLQERITNLENRNAELKGMYAHSAREAETYKQFFEKEKTENAKLKSRDCWKSCEYANPKAELIGQHIKDVQNLTKAKEIIKYLLSFIQKENYKTRWDINITEAEQFLKENE